jgi:hypothetical protein
MLLYRCLEIVASMMVFLGVSWFELYLYNRKPFALARIAMLPGNIGRFFWLRSRSGGLWEKLGIYRMPRFFDGRSPLPRERTRSSAAGNIVYIDNKEKFVWLVSGHPMFRAVARIMPSFNRDSINIRIKWIPVPFFGHFAALPFILLLLSMAQDAMPLFLACALAVVVLVGFMLGLYIRARTTFSEFADDIENEIDRMVCDHEDQKMT